MKTQMKETFLLFSSSVLGSRYLNKIRLRFLQYLRKDLEEQGHTCLLWEERKGNSNLYNLAVGNFLEANKVIVVGYDTPSRVLLPNYLYYPLNNKKNYQNENKSFIVKAIISLLLIFLGAFLVYYTNSFSMPFKILSILTIALILFFIISLNKGFGNLFNFNKNTGAVAIAYEFLRQLKTSNSDVAVVFLDRVATSYIGYAHLKELFEKEEKQREVIILDCIAVGLSTFFISDLKQKKMAENLGALYKNQNKSIISLNREEVSLTPLSFFPNAVLITCGDLMGEDVIVRNTRSNKDIVFDLDQMESIKKCLYKHCCDGQGEE